MAVDITLLGASRTLSGQISFANGELQKLQLVLLPGPLSLGSLTIGGNGTCPARITLSVSPVPNSLCLAVDYDRTATPSLQMMVRGQVTVLGAVATIDGVLDATHAEIAATATVPFLGTLSLNGVLFTATNPDARILDKNGVTVAAVPETSA